MLDVGSGPGCYRRDCTVGTKAQIATLDALDFDWVTRWCVGDVNPCAA
jgi:hypothetical protein